MVTYVRTIGNGTATYDYTSVQLWYSTNKSAADFPDGDVAYLPGDVVVAKLQNSSDGHTGTHAISHQHFGGGADVWDANISEVIISGTNSDRSDWSDPSCTLGSNTSYIKAHNSNKVYKYENLDLYVDNSVGISPGVNATDANTGDSLTIEFNNCRVYSPNTGANQYIIRSLYDFSSVEVKVKINNSTIDTRRSFAGMNLTSAGASGVMIIEAVGSTFRSSWNSDDGCPFQPYYGSDTPGGRFEVHTSGCLYDASTNLPFVRNATGNYYTSGTATDMITSDSVTNLGNWADTQTNASAGITFNYGSAPGTNEVSFSGAYDAALPNLILYDDSNNLAKGFVSNVTLSSPDLAGNSRGTSPFDAGAFELAGGGGIPPITVDTPIALFVTPINLY